MKKFMNLAGVALAVAMGAGSLWAQLDGSTRGVVKGTDGKPIVGATVQLYDATSGRKYQAKTNDKGEYVIAVVYQGTYTYTLLQNGNPVDEKDNVPIATGQDRVVDFTEGGGAPAAAAAPNPKEQASQKQNDNIKKLNNSLKQAKELEGAGNYDQAITVLQQATQMDPNQDLVWAYLGDAQRGDKKYTDAIESYQKALAIKPNHGPYLGQLGDAYAKAGQTDKAVESYAAAAQADPQNAGNYYYNEGAILTNSGKTDEAIAAFDKAIQIDPNRADAYYWKGVDLIGKATMKDNKMVAPPGTADAFNKYLELQPTGKYADAAKQMLASIGASVETSYGKSKAKK